MIGPWTSETWATKVVAEQKSPPCPTATEGAGRISDLAPDELAGGDLFEHSGFVSNPQL